MAISVIPLRLDSDIEFEQRVRALYDAKPRARRQEWLRRLLLLGLTAADGELSDVPAVARALKSDAPVAGVKPQRERASYVEVAPSVVGTSSAVVEATESASVLRGFIEADAPQVKP